MTHLSLFFSYDISLKTWAESGLARRDSLLYEHLTALGHLVSFITYGIDDKRFLAPDSRIQVLERPGQLSSGHYGWRIPFLHGQELKRADVIKSHQTSGARYAVWAKWVHGKPYIARCGYIPSFFALAEGRSKKRYRQLWAEEFWAFQNADVVCVPSRAEADYIQRVHKVNHKKIHVCPNWIDIGQFKPDPHVSRNKRRICFVGRFSNQKQPLFLLEAVKDMNDIELVMAGGGPLKQAIEEKVKEYNLNAKILDRIANEDLPALYNSSAIYVLPTIYEGGSPKTLLEAMACGLPVVSTNAFGVNEAFEHNVHGIKCDPSDILAMREAILSLLDDPARAFVLGEQGRKHVVENYSVERAVERELEIFKKIAVR